MLPLRVVSGMVLVEPVVPLEPIPEPVVEPELGAPDEPVEPPFVVEGVVVEEEPGDLTVSSVFLLQPPSASAAARASATAPAVLSVGAYISVSFM